MNCDLLIDTLRHSKKYRDIDLYTLSSVCEAESKKYKSEKLVLKSAKNKLHQIHSAFLPSSSHEKAFSMLDILKKDTSIETLKTVCANIMRLHASTSERLEIYTDFYNEIFNVAGQPNTVLDIACGFNPFSIPWMGLKDLAEYRATDINYTSCSLLNAFFELTGCPGIAITQNVLSSILCTAVDMVFIFKLLPLIERQQAGYSKVLLETINADFIVVTFPVQSLSGKSKGMELNYSNFFESMIPDNWTIKKRMVIFNELMYIISRNCL